MKKWYIKRIQDRLARHFTCNFSRIPPERFVCGEIRYNYECHRNSVHHASTEPGKKVILTYCIDQRTDFGFLHVINRLPDGRYQDNTLGSEHSTHTYYLIKECLPDQLHRCAEWFNDHRRDWIRLQSRYWLVKLLGIEPSDVF